MKKNSNLTSEQENILFNEATEPPGSSELNSEKNFSIHICTIIYIHFNFICRKVAYKYEKKRKERFCLLCS